MSRYVRSLGLQEYRDARAFIIVISETKSVDFGISVDLSGCTEIAVKTLTGLASFVLDTPLLLLMMIGSFISGNAEVLACCTLPALGLVRYKHCNSELMGALWSNTISLHERHLV